METVVEFLKVAAGMFTIMVAWLGLQAVVRRRSGCGRDQDVLDFMAHGCAGCKGSGACRKKADRELPHESA